MSEQRELTMEVLSDLYGTNPAVLYALLGEAGSIIARLLDERDAGVQTEKLRSDAERVRIALWPARKAWSETL